MKVQIEGILQNIQNKLTVEGKKRVFEDEKELKSEDLKERQNPEEFTREFLIDKILFEILKVERTGPKNFDTTDGTPRMVDYAVKYEKNRILIEAKPINDNLYDKSQNAAVNQIIGIFRLVEARDKFDFGIATDGLKWVFISTEGNSEEFDIRKDFNEIKKRIVGEEKILQKKMEDISKKFYEHYNDLIHGIKRISKNDCLVNSILHVDNEEDREEIAQVVIDRLIFIKFLEAKGIIKEHVLDYLYNLEDHELNLKLNQLFFEVMSTKKKDRGSVDPHFVHIPYLNGSLFDKLDVEKRNPNYKIRARILHKVIEFLNKFKFVHHESSDSNGDFIDPEILGYIFERAMTATDRKGTGAYYTPKEITRYIAENTIYPNIIDKVNEFLIKKKGYKKSETIKNIEELFILRETTLNEVWTKIILDTSVCDNACGSGAFLLAAANVLFNLNKRINDNLGLRNSDVALKKLVLKSLYGVDINPRAIEIALLRLWLWLAESYKPEHIEPLPNIEYNLRVGNTLVGYANIEQFGTTKVSLDDFLGDDETTKLLLKKYRKLKNKYVKATGDEARNVRKDIEDIRLRIKRKLDKELYQDILAKDIKISKEEYFKLKPFHIGFEFYEVFDLDKKNAERGFDVIIGNPPWGIKYGKKERTYFSDLHPNVADFESSQYFISQSICQLNSTGSIGLIIPNTFALNVFARKCRTSVLEKTSVRIMIDLSDRKVFEGPSVRSMILIYDRGKSTACHVLSSNKGGQLFGLLRKIKQNQLIQSETWTPFFKVVTPKSKIIDKIIQENITLSEYCNVRQGYIPYRTTTLTGRFGSEKAKEIVKKRLWHSEKRESSEYLKELQGADVERYSLKWSGVWIKYGEWVSTYLPLSVFSGQRVLVREITRDLPKSLLATYTDEIYVHNPSVLAVLPKSNNISPKFILGVINSKLMSILFHYVAPKARKGLFPKIIITDAKRLPFPSINLKNPSDKNIYNKIISLVDKRLTLQKQIDDNEAKEIIIFNKINKLEKEIDELVYDLYGLTDNEITLIEENFKN